MKTKSTTNGIITLALSILLTIMLAFTISCKKKDSTPDPTPTPPGPVPTPLANPDVFQRKPLKMMSDYEIANSLTFPVYQQRLFGKIMVGDDDPVVPDPLKYVGQTLQKVKAYQTTQHQFQTVNIAYDQLVSQLMTLQSSINNMGTVLGIDVTQCLNMITSGDLNTQIGNVNSIWSAAASNNGFMWYSEVAANWESDPTNQAYITQMNAAQSDVDAFCINVRNNGSNPGGMINCINQIYEDICPTDGTGTNAIGAYAKLIIQEVTAKGKITTAAGAMAAYVGLESYFLTAMNYQTRAAIIYANACNEQDPTGALGYDTAFWNQCYIPAITPEVNVFLSAVNYLYINLADYRTTSRFQSDMAYANTGLAPDEIWKDALARSQFVANLIYDGLGFSYPVMCGTILTPWNYTNGNSPIVNQLNLQFVAGNQRTVTLNANTLQSQIPYTYWTQGSTATLASDYKWNVYQMGTLGVGDAGWATGTIQVTDGGSTQSPWRHVSPIKGNVSVLWYNPKNPLDSASARSNTYCMQFAYFMANWQWGYLNCSDFQTGQWSHQTYYAPNFNSQIIIPEECPTTPFTGTTDHGNTLYNWTGTFSYPDNSFGTMLMGGNMINTSYYFLAADLITINVSAVSDPSTITNNELQAWSYYKCYYDMTGSGSSDLWVDMGVGINYIGSKPTGGYVSDGSQINVHFTNQVGNWNSGVGTCGSLKSNTVYQPSIQYNYQTQNCGSNPANIQLYTGFQFVYTGLYNLPPNP